MASKIEDMIIELQDYIDSCKSPAFKADSIIVNRDDIESYIEDLRANIPDEIRQYQRIINNQEHILADARKKADAIIKEAEIETDKLVSEHQIMQQAYAKANELVLVASKEAENILDKANTEANEIKGSAMEYTDTNLKIIQEIITASMETTKSKADNYMNQMQGYLDTIVSNRSELAPTIASLYGAPAPNGKEDVPIESIGTVAANASNSNRGDAKPAANAADNNASGDSSKGGDSSKNVDSSNSSGIDVPDVFFNKE